MKIYDFIFPTQEKLTLVCCEEGKTKRKKFIDVFCDNKYIYKIWKKIIQRTNAPETLAYAICYSNKGKDELYTIAIYLRLFVDYNDKELIQYLVTILEDNFSVRDMVNIFEPQLKKEILPYLSLKYIMSMLDYDSKLFKLTILKSKILPCNTSIELLNNINPKSLAVSDVVEIFETQRYSYETIIDNLKTFSDYLNKYVFMSIKDLYKKDEIKSLCLLLDL